MKRTAVVIALWAMVVGTVTAQKAGSEQQLSKEASSYFGAGDYLKAYPIYSQLVSLHPKNEDYLYRFGACAIYSDADKSKAIQYLSSATRKDAKDPMAWYYLGKAYHLNYQFSDAVKAYETFVSKADPKVSAKLNAQREIETCIYGSNLLSNIKDIQVLSKVEADRANFFRYMDLDGVGGKILTVPDELRSSYDKKSKDNGVIHFPGNSTTIYFSSYGKDGSTGKDIYRANILTEGKFSTPEKLTGGVNTKYDEDFCFMQSDGKTLYFASKGHNSMGGYDIFKSVLDPSKGTFGPAINLDFAINTPDDDIFYVADSLNQRAYFASGRASDQNHIHVYGVKVQGIPLQIIYLKGEFISEIDPSQKKARIQIKEEISGRLVMDVNSDQSSGDYMFYVPKGGKYNLFVKTENGPVMHQADIDIPSFDKPVALRQEMRLVNQGGQEKLIVTNFFEIPLEEDLASLAASMLREKSKLDVNASEGVEDEVAPVATTVEREMQNTALAAGFAEGVTALQLADGMNREANAIAKFVAEADQKYNNAYAYAQKKQYEAESALSQAEIIRETSGNLSSDEDIIKTREMLTLLSRAADLQRESRSAVAAAEAVKQYRTSEEHRGQELKQNATTILNSQNSGDFDAAVKALSAEKGRQNKMRETPVTPFDEMIAKAKSSESALHNSEDRLTRMREEEKRLQTDVKLADQKINTVKKKSEKQKAELEYQTLKSELDNKRREIVQEKIKTEENGARAKDAIASAEFFNRLSNDTQLGLSLESQNLVLDETQRSTLSMKLNAMDNRIETLQITDPQMLAMITEGAGAGHEAPKYTSTAVTSNTVLSQLPVRSSTEMVSRKDQSLAILPSNDPTLASARRMVIANTLEEVNLRIQSIEAKKSSGITVQEKNELAELTTSRTQLRTELRATQTPPSVAIPDQLRVIYQSVNPQYNEQIQTINNGPGTELDRTMQMVAMKEQMLVSLKKERLLNASSAMDDTDPKRIAERARRDQELELAVRAMETETSSTMAYKGAYETENKDILESDLTVASKLDSQITLTESYLNVLGELEAKEQARLAVENDQEVSVNIRTRVGELKKESDIANARLASYRQDLSLTTSASDPATAQTASTAKPNFVNTLEDELEVEENTRLEGAEKLSAKMSEAELAKKVEQDAETIKALFKQKAEAESIFAYETGELQALIVEHDNEGTKVRNLEKINSLQQDIFLIEAEIETESNPNKQRKMDRKAEDLYFRKALLEIGNANGIQEMMASEYTEAAEKVKEFKIARAEVINSRTMVRDEINKLTNQAASTYDEALDLRKKAANITDDIEKNDYFRQAFAKEQLAVQLLRQASEISSQLDLLTEYDDSELTELRYGNPSKVSLAMTEESKSPSTSQSSNTLAESSASTTEPDSNESSSDASVAETAIATPNASGINYANYGSDAVTDTKSVRAEGNNVEKVLITVPMPEGSKASPASSSASMPSAESRANAGSYSESEASSYYYEFPTTLTKDIFVMTRSSVYSDARPMPVDATMPSGVYYKVQVGAFRNKIPQNLYSDFAPVSGESLNNGITRYTAGFFMNFDNADDAKLTIRRMGYGDAFVVAFRDGKRIPLYEAMGLTETDYAAAVEKEYIYGDGGEAPVSRKAPVLDPTAIKTSTKRTDYYAGAPNAAPAKQVEAMTGLFYTVQIGVYSKPVPASTLKNLSPLNSELTSTNKIRYTTGVFTSLVGAVAKRDQAKSLGIDDAFITAYYNGERITLSEADRLIKENGPSILYK